ncbi:sexual differentiation process protein isp4 [Verticillium dahliae VdLs.17]|uniref:Sexual differentiation process protein isp4 n=1 Tax=Verticillium dahliae (strain VdLs.17 / ATCC MYA-4575 / FGSC 10137) TaxID=498257 RepID=G2X687_VERDV|nr:sexual differentiation process protein isp4 [Verticillium dahliae VdLs.17]EGY14505.1 sexual differentiation process protein isp4 [Verticillium dahliae VdLs.17]KAH6708447.1 sexual differentiation process protein isp4 [Verticillium dahliae]
MEEAKSMPNASVTTVPPSQGLERGPEQAKRPSDESSAPSEDVLFTAGIGLEKDDPTLPCLTIRMWVIGIVFCLLGSGKAWEFFIPDWGITVFGHHISLNPGPFNYKEKILIYILANLSFLTRLSADVLTEQRVFYGLKAGWGFELTMTLATILFGFSLAGIFRSLVVEPASLVWPGVLGNTALNHTLHSRKNTLDLDTKFKMSRYQFFMIVFCGSFCRYWFPDFIFPALGYFTLICWAAPNNAVVNQISGMKSGLGILPVTFDWSQIAYIGSPLVVPTWAILNVLASLIFWIYAVSPAIYYSNTWSSAYLPIQSDSVYDNTGAIYLPVTYALNTFGLSFATISSLLIWLYLERRHSIIAIFQASSLSSLFKRGPIPSWNLQPAYKTVPAWWWHGVLLALVICAVFFVALALVYATANVKIQIDIFCRIVAGYVYEGKVLANIWFFNVGYISGIKGLAFAQDLKLGLYCNIPPRKLFLVQAVGIVMGTLGQVSTLNWALEQIPHICTDAAPNGFTCPFSRTHFNTTSGTNYGSWAIVGLVFGLWLKRRERDWWRRYNFVLSSALDCSVAIAGVIIFFAVFYTGAANNFA